MKKCLSLLFLVPCLAGAVEPNNSGGTPGGWLWDPQAQTVSLCFTGDIMAHNVNYLQKDYGAIYEGVTDLLKTFDLKFANFEFPMDDLKPNSNFPFFNCTPKYAEAAILAGFNVFTNANNHANDQGASGIQRTIVNMKAFEKKYGIHWSGLREKPDEPMKLTIIDVRGVKIGFVGITNLLNSWVAKGLVYFPNYADIGSGVLNLPNSRAFLNQLKEWRTQVDLMIVGIHDGVEYLKFPRDFQKTFYHEMLDAGVDIVWGSHPHVLFPWEQVWKDGRQKVIFYSLGNFISGQSTRVVPTSQEGTAPRTGDGVLMEVRIRKDHKGTRIESVTPHWTNNFRDPQKGMIVRLTRDLSENAPGVWKKYYALRLKQQEVLESPWVEGKPPVHDIESSRLIRFP